MRATVVMKEGETLDKTKVEQALKLKSLELVSLENVRVKVPKAAYVLRAAVGG